MAELTQIKKAWLHFKEMLGTPIPTQLGDLIQVVDHDIENENINNLKESIPHLNARLKLFEDIKPLQDAYANVVKAQEDIAPKKSP